MITMTMATLIAGGAKFCDSAHMFVLVSLFSRTM